MSAQDANGDGYDDFTGEYIGDTSEGGTGDDGTGYDDGSGYDEGTGGSGDEYLFSIDSDNDGISDGNELNGIDIVYLVEDTFYVEDYDENGDLIMVEVTGFREEYSQVFLDPYNPDSDNDLIPDGLEVDLGLNPTDSADGDRDADFDGLSLGEELAIGTQFNNPDSDGDGYLDGEEVLIMGSDPMDEFSPDSPDDQADEGSGGSAGGGEGDAGTGDGTTDTGGESGTEGGTTGGGTETGEPAGDGGGGSNEEPAGGEGDPGVKIMIKHVNAAFGQELGGNEGGTTNDEHITYSTDDPSSDFEFPQTFAETIQHLDNTEFPGDGTEVALPLKAEFESSTIFATAWDGSEIYDGEANLFSLFLDASSDNSRPVTVHFLKIESTNDEVISTSTFSLTVAPGGKSDEYRIIPTGAPGEKTSITIRPIPIMDANHGDADSDGIPDYADGFEDLFSDKGVDPNDFRNNPDYEEDDRLPESAPFQELDLESAGPQLRGHNAGVIPSQGYGFSNNAQVVIKKIESFSDPGSLGWVVDEQGESAGEVSMPNDIGKMRVWTKPAHLERNTSTIGEGGHLLRQGDSFDYEVIRNGLWLESTDVSQTAGDHLVHITIDEPGDSKPPIDFVWSFTSILTGFHAVDVETGQISNSGKLEFPHQSLPNPEITITDFSIVNPRPSPDGQSLIADISYEARITSAICDLSPEGELGEIRHAYTTLNTLAEVVEREAVQVSKAVDPVNLARPFPYEGTITKTLIAVPVIEGNNVFTIATYDPVYRLPGAATASFEIAATPGPNADGGASEEITVSFPGETNTQLAEDEIEVTYTQNGQTVIDGEILIRSSESDTTYNDDDSDLTLSLGAVPVLDSETSDSISVTITGTSSGNLQFTYIPELSADANTFIATLGGGAFVSYEGWEVTSVEHTASSEGGGTYSPMVVKVEGPNDVVRSMKSVTFAGASVELVEKENEFYFAREDDKEKVATLAILPIPETGPEDPSVDISPPISGGELPDDWISFDAMAAEAERFDRDFDDNPKFPDIDLQNRLRKWMAMTASDTTDKQFYKGLGSGFMGNPKETAQSIWGLAKSTGKFLWKAGVGAWKFTVGGVIYETFFDDNYQGEMKFTQEMVRKVEAAYDIAADAWPAVRDFLKNAIDTGSDAMLTFLQTGEFPSSDKVGKAVKTALFTVVNLILKAQDWWMGLESFKRGYYMGYIMFEVVVGIVAGVITAPAGGTGAVGIALAKWGPKFMNILKFLKTKIVKLMTSLGDDAVEVAPMANAIDDLTDGITVSRATRLCFAAGTVIMTVAGPVAIEQVKAGDYVYSAHEETGEFGIRPVMETYVNEAEEVIHLRYTQVGKGGETTEHELTTTSEHPFWSVDSGSFVAAATLRAGETLKLMGGGTAKVASLVAERAPPGETIKVYNFAVADHHTYFAGEGGVWVHNLCSAKLDEVAAEFETILEATIKKQGNTDAAWQAAERKIREKIQDLRKPGGEELSASDHADIGGYLSARMANRGTHLARPTPWRIVSGNGAHEWIDADFVPDPRLVEEVRNLRLNSPEGNLLTKAGMERNAACVKYQVNGEVRFEAMLNHGRGGSHSEELLSDFLHELRLRHGNKLEVEEIFTERIPCTNSGGCRPMMSADMKGAQVSFWTREKGAVAESQLSGIYGLD